MTSLLTPPPMAGNQTDAQAPLNNGEPPLFEQKAVLSDSDGNAAEDDDKPVLTAEELSVALSAGADAVVKFKDFLGQVTDLAFGPSSDTKGAIDFKSFAVALENRKIIPTAEFFDSSKPELRIKLPAQNVQAARMMDTLRDNYFVAKSQTA